MISPDPADEGQLHDEKALRDFKRSHRQMRRNWDLPSKFPDIRVIDAYRKVFADKCLWCPVSGDS